MIMQTDAFQKSASIGTSRDAPEATPNYSILKTQWTRSAHTSEPTSSVENSAAMDSAAILDPELGAAIDILMSAQQLGADSSAWANLRTRPKQRKKLRPIPNKCVLYKFIRTGHICSFEI